MKATPEHAAGICRVHNLTWQDTYPNQELGITIDDIKAMDLASDQKVADRKKFLSNIADDACIFVALLAGNVGGFCLGTKFVEYNKVNSLYVLPDWHGRGIGTKLIDHIFGWFDEPKNCFLKVAAYNDKAISFYRRHGFASTGVIQNFSRHPHGKQIPGLIMRRDKEQFEVKG